MKALLIVAHGSRSQVANDEVCRLAERIDEDSGPAFDRVDHAFLEIASPQFDTAIDTLAAAGITEITVFPYFLAAGAHVANDIPNVIGVAKRAYSEIDFEILPYLGALEGIGALILKQIGESRGPAD
jgi:sirohydrochlorin ferrochelatase